MSSNRPTEQEFPPCHWMLPKGSLNNLQQSSIARLVELAAQAHTVDVKVRINGEDRWFQVDWLKNLRPWP